MRFIRDYRLTIKTGHETIKISSPMRINFNINKSIDGLLNGCTIKIYNLKNSSRLALVKDEDDEKYIPVSLYVGYKNKIEKAFRGNIYRGQNARSGADIITTIDCLDGGEMLNAFISETITKNDYIIEPILKSLTNIGKGKINKRQNLLRPKVLVGNPIDILNSMTLETEKWYIDNEQLNIIDVRQVTSYFIPPVNAKNGLIETPSKQEQRITFKILINPTITIGRLVNLSSTTAPNLNGIYKIYNIVYNGDSYGSEWTQTCSGYLNSDYEVI